MDLRLIPYPSANFGLPDVCENLAAVLLLLPLLPPRDPRHRPRSQLLLHPLLPPRDPRHPPTSPSPPTPSHSPSQASPIPSSSPAPPCWRPFHTLDMPGLLRKSEFNSYGPIPADLSRLSNVVELDFCQNNLSGYVPSELSNCSSLVTLLNLPEEEFPAEIETSQPGEPSKNRRDLAGERGRERVVKVLSASWALRREKLEKREEGRGPERRLRERERTWRERMTGRARGRKDALKVVALEVEEGGAVGEVGGDGPSRLEGNNSF